MVVQRLRFPASNAGGLGFTPGWETRPYMPQLRLGVIKQMRYFFKKKKRNKKKARREMVS